MTVTTGIQLGQQLGPQGIGLRRCVAVVVDAQATTKINVVNGNARRLDVAHQIQNAVHRVQVGRGFGDLRANVAVDADHLQARQAGGMAVGAQGVFMGDAKFVALQSGGNIGVGFGVHIGVHAQADRGFLSEAKGHFAEHLQLGFAFDVEATDAHLQGLFHLGAGFAHARKNDLGRIGTGRQHAGQFAA